MHSNSVRFIANGIITVFSLLIIFARLYNLPSSGEYWLWALPALFILILDIYFLTKSMIRQPKDTDTGLVTFLISVGGTMGFGLSALALNQPLLQIPFRPKAA